MAENTKNCDDCGTPVTLDEGYYDGPEGVFCLECDAKNDGRIWDDLDPADPCDGPLLPGHFLPPGCRIACEPDPAGWDYDRLL